MPLSYTFLVEEIAKSDELLARKLDDYIVQDIKIEATLFVLLVLLLVIPRLQKQLKNILNSDNSNLVSFLLELVSQKSLLNPYLKKQKELISNPDLL